MKRKYDYIFFDNGTQEFINKANKQREKEKKLEEDWIGQFGL